ncbi:MAG: HAMP domain-containing sensor histidine kinase [bacterium]|nr:HAMP domain-containing histidine kinase [Acidimicrobiia bacterium]MCY4649019.1 HAMP domain-containing sensor histidine kinase [bacterium]
MSLRWRWALSLGLVAAVAIGLTAWAAILSAERQLHGAVNADLREKAAVVIKSAGALPTGSRPHLAKLGLDIVEEGMILQIFRPNGETVLRIGRGDLIPPIETVDVEVVSRNRRWVLRDVRIRGVPFRMITARLPHLLAEDSSGLGFQIARDMTRVNANLVGLTRRMVPIGGIGILLVGLTGWFLASRAVRPVRNLTEAAEEIAATERFHSAGQLDHSAPGEIGRLAAAFSRMLSALSASRREQQRLVSDAGHEFRTPITALKTNLETLLRQDRQLSDIQRRELLEAAVTQSNQLAGLATELVDLATDVQHHDEDPTDIDLGELAADVALRFRQIGPTELSVTGEGTSVRGRRSQLERALGNLVDNAAKWATTTVEINLEGGKVTVRDDGPGIPKDDLPHIFRRFYRSRQAHPTPGSGLGLAIVEHLITAHGGTVFAGNRAHGGAEVGFILPVEDK